MYMYNIESYIEPTASTHYPKPSWHTFLRHCRYTQILDLINTYIYTNITNHLKTFPFVYFTASSFHRIIQ